MSNSLQLQKARLFPNLAWDLHTYNTFYRWHYLPKTTENIEELSKHYQKRFQ